MKTNNIIISILNLPKTFQSLKNISVYALLKETGYFEKYEKVKEVDLHEEIIRNSELVHDWLIWSGNKRNSSGWYFMKNDKEKYVVGYFPPNEGLKQIEYYDSNKACAAFIIREIEEIRKS